MAGLNPNNARLAALGVADYAALDRKEMIPGVLYRGLLTNADQSWIPANDQLLEAVARLWEKLKGTGFITDYQIARAQAINRAGVLCVPASVTAIKNADPGRPFDRLEPQTLANPAARAAWDKVIAVFKNSLSLYFKARFNEGLEEVRKAEADVAMWDTIYNGVKVVSELPQMAAEAVVGGVGSFVKGNMLFVALVAGGAALVFFGPSMLTKFAAKAAE